MNEPLTLLLLVLNAVGAAVQCASYLPLLAVLARGEAQGLTGTQLDGLAAWRSPCTTAVSSPRSCSSPPGCSRWAGWSCDPDSIPRFLGWLLLLDAVGVSCWLLQAFLAPGHPALSYRSWAVGFIAEVGFALWLVIKGASPDEREDAPPRRGR